MASASFVRPAPVAWLLLAGSVTAGLLFTGCQPQKAPAEAGAPQIHRLASVPPEALTRYAGSTACAECHADAAQKHEGSHHAEALTRVSADNHGDRFRLPTKMVDPKRKLSYRTEVTGEDCNLVARYEDREATVKALWGFGSGKHATTYLGSFRNDFLELRLTYYRDANRWHFSPAQQVEKVGGGTLYPQGITREQKTIEECFVCHSTAVVKRGEELLPDQSIFGVGCESCHGPAKDHVVRVRQTGKDPQITRLGQIKGRVSVELCGQCHRSPVSEDVHDPFNQSQLPRLQGLALAQSRCFTESQGRLGCLSCHNAHGDAKQTQAEYNTQCMSCHAPARTGPDPACTLESKGDCVSCHMPKQSVGMPTDPRYRTHWIKVWGLDR